MTFGPSRVRAALARERKIIREHRPELGLRGVLRQRAQALLGMEGIDGAVAAATWSHADALATHERRIGVVQEEIAGVLAAHERRIEALQEELRTVRGIAAQARTLATFDLTERSLAARFDADDALVTVILPTYDRAPYLRRAVASVLAQSHERWELIVVDTGGTPQTAEVLASFDDPRIRVIDADGARSAVARNAALEDAHGEVVTYLDDDNVMLPWWLRVVALTAREHPDRLVFYGARVIEQPPGDDAWWQFEPFDRDEHTRRNLTDTGMIAHRRSDEVRWSENHPRAADWELVRRLAAAGHEPLAVPVRAVLYTTSAPGRMSDGPQSIQPKLIDVQLGSSRS